MCGFPRCAKIFRLPYFSIFLRGAARCASAILQFIWPGQGRTGRVDLNVYTCMCACVRVVVVGYFGQVYAPYSIHHLISTCRQRCCCCHCKIYDFTRRCRHGLSPRSNHTHTHTQYIYIHSHTHYAHTKLSTFKTPSAKLCCRRLPAVSA